MEAMDNIGKALHGAAEAATVIRSPNRVSFDDNVRVSQINPNDTNMSSDMNKENPMVSVTNSDVFNVSPSFSIDENLKPASPASYNDSFEYFWGASKGVFKTMNVRCWKLKELRNPEIVEGAAVALPMDAVDAISSRFANTLFGYFIGKRLAFPLVENYVKNTWAKYGLKRIQLHEGFFMFQFNTKEGMESVMENGPWLIRYVPLILNVWTPNTDLKKDVIKTAPLWVKLHHVPIVAYSEVGLSLITTQLGRPLMLDSYTSSMCLSSWGRNTYARASIEFSCIIFYDSCPKNPKVVTNDKEKDDGFIKYRKVDKGETSKKNDSNKIVPNKDSLVLDIAMREFKGVCGWRKLEVMDVQEYGPSINLESKPKGKFKDIVNETWNIDVSGFFMFRIVKKLKFMKKLLRKLMYDKGNLHANVDLYPSVKSRVSRSRIEVVMNNEGLIFANDKVPDAFISHYEMFIGQAGDTNGFDDSNLFTTQACRIVGDDVIKAIHEFFTNGKLLKELNHTIIALILKVQAPSRINDYRPISCFGYPKAYDTVDWNFLRTILVGFGFHNRMISWIMECVTTTSYSICINGTLHGYFQGKRGLRQGDPLSPYLFTLVMEVLTLMIQRRVLETNQFTFHRYCAKLNLINLCFADDLFLFAHGDVQSATIIKNGLDEFKHASGLIPSLPKSTAYFCNVLNHIKISILNVLPFEEGRLPVKYLGVPLISSRLMVRDCKELVEKFLWCPGNSSKGKAKVAWEVVCLPKDEGGLGIRRLDRFNSALMVTHLWKLLSSKESLWVKWVHMYKLNGRNFWDIPLRANMSGSCVKFYNSSYIREFVWCNVGNGLSTSLWFDKWCVAGPLYNHVSSRDVFRSGLTLSSHVNDIVRDGVWDNIQFWTGAILICLMNVIGWNAVFTMSKAGLDRVSHDIYAIVDHIGGNASRKSTCIVIAKLVVAASAYFIWQERNWRLFKKTKRSTKQVIDCISSSVRLKLLSCGFKRTLDGVRYARMWELPDSIFR
ncbi:putative reverse transcriptase domain, reverse transcriptase zinc-binding domain protein [Tanacetum coccineum]